MPGSWVRVPPLLFSVLRQRRFPARDATATSRRQLVDRARRKSAIGLPALEVSRHAGLPRDPSTPAPMVTWSATATCPPSTTKSPNVTLPEIPHLADQDLVAADSRGVPDLDEVVDLRPFSSDDRVAEGAAIDRRVGPELDVVVNDDAASIAAPSGVRWVFR